MFYEAPSDFLSYLPERLGQVREFGVLAEAINPEMDGLNRAIAALVANASVSTADQDGVLRWERMLGIASPMHQTLESRREALRAKLMTKPPINLETLRRIIEAYMGVQVEIAVEDSICRVRYRGQAKEADLTPLFGVIYETIPASLLVIITYHYLVWSELDAQGLRFAALDGKNLNWTQFERGEWIG